MNSFLMPLLLLLAALLRVHAASFDQVRPLLEENCLACHHPEKQKGGLNLESRASMLEGGDTAEAIDLEQPSSSELLRRILLSHDDDEFMPVSTLLEPRDPLTLTETELLRSWILAGAPWPEEEILKPRDPKRTIGSLSHLSVSPSFFSLDHRDASFTLRIFGHLDDGSLIDLTQDAEVSVPDPKLLSLDDTRVSPGPQVQDLTSQVTVTFRHHRLDVPVRLRSASASHPISFRQDVIPVLTAAGCNTGSCHGSARGQDGFMLSLFGYDPEGDHHRLTREMPGRRLNLALPAESLLLTKATNTVPHSGNRLFSPDHPFHSILQRWIEEGARLDEAQIAKPETITVTPATFVLTGSGKELPLSVLATYSDGSRRDVTSLTTFTSSDDATLSVIQDSGKVRSHRPGEALILARFHTLTEGSQGIVIPADRNFVPTEESSLNFIDQLVTQKLNRLHLTPSPPADEPTLVRRLYLDLAGRLPTPEEVQNYLKNEEREKATQLVDLLIASQDFTDLWTMKWAELLQIRSTGRAANTITPKASRLWHQWLAEQMSSDRPFHEIIHDLLSAEGGTFDTPQTNFYKLVNDPKLITENVAQVFMGTRIQCAQCHNHPFDRWTMDDYYGFASFFSQIKRKAAADPAEQIIFDGGGEIKHPLTKRPVPPRFLGGDMPEKTALRKESRRHVAASWLTAPENPWFAKNVANIMWAHFFGPGLVEPVDDVRISNPPSNPALLDALAQHLVRENFSLRSLARAICTSDTYRRSSLANQTNRHDSRNYARSFHRRLRAEVLMDALATATGTSNKFTGLKKGERATRIPDGTTTNYFLKTFGRSTRKTVCSCEVRMEPNLSQALHLLNGETVSKRIQQGKVIPKLIKGKKDNAAIIEHIYLRTLSRPPSAAELNRLLASFPAGIDRLPVLEDIFWALLNSKEFLFNH